MQTALAITPHPTYGTPATLERTLDRAVLPALAVQDGQGNVNEKWTYATLEHLDEAARGQERDGRAVVRVPRPRSELCGVTRVVQPAGPLA